MKRTLLLLAGIAVLLVASGCASGSQTGTAQSAQSAASQSESAAPDREQVRNAYDRAVAAAEWFRDGTMPCSGGIVSMESGLYRKVSYAGVETLEDLKNYLRGLFSEELVNRLLTKKADGESVRFLEKDGKLYELQNALGSKEKTGDIRVSVKRKSASRFEVDVQTELLTEDEKTVTGVKYNACFCERREGKWIFTSFDLPGTQKE
jgi:uncharacterized protein YceK